MKTTVARIERLTDTIYSFHLTKPPVYRFIAGQFVEITLPGPKSNNNKRWFTLSSAPSEDFLTFTTKIPERRSEYKTILEGLRPGDQLEVSQPLGDFIFPKLSSIPIIGLSGGMGTTPFRSMITEANYLQEDRDIHLFSSFRARSDVIFDNDFRTLGDSFHLYVDKRIDMQDVLAAASDLQKTYFFLAGPEGFIEELTSQLKNASVPDNHIFTDAFIGL